MVNFFERDMKFPACLSHLLDLIHLVDIQKSWTSLGDKKGNFGAMKHIVIDSRKEAIMGPPHWVLWFCKAS